MSLVRQSVLASVGTAILATGNLGIGILLARWLSPDGLGQYALLTSTASLLGVIGTLGLGGAAIYFTNSRRMALGVVTTAVVRTSLLIGLTLAIVLGVTVRYHAYFGASPTIVAIAVALLVFGKVFVPATMYLLIAAGNVMKYVVVQVAPTLLLLAVIGFLAFEGALTIAPALWAAATSQVVGMAVIIAFVRPDLDLRGRFPWSALKELIGYGALINVAHFVYLGIQEGGVVMMRAFAPAFDEIGFYQASLKLASIVVMAVLAVGPLLFRKFAGSEDVSRPRHVERTCRVFWLGVIAMVAVGELVARPLVILLFGVEYEPAIPVLRVTLVGMAASAVLQPILQLFYSIGAPGLVSAVLAANVALMGALMFVLVPDNGAAGAAWSFVGANTFTLALGYLIGGVRHGIRLRDCFIVTPQDVSFVITNLRKAPLRSGSS